MTSTPAGTDAALAGLRLDFAARIAAHRQALADVRTEVLSRQALAEEFGISKNYVRGLLERMDGTERVGRTGRRVRVLKVPPAYSAAAGLLHAVHRERRAA